MSETMTAGQATRRASALPRLWPAVIVIGVALAIGAQSAPTPIQNLELRARTLIRLGESCGRRVMSVAWLDDGSLLLGSDKGVWVYDLMSRSARQVVKGAPIPEGIGYAMRVATDGQSAIAVSPQMEQFAFRVKDGKRIFARASRDFYVLDAALRGDRLYVMGWPSGPSGAKNAAGGAVWSGPAGGDFSHLLPVHSIHSGPEAVSLFNDSVLPHGGAMAFDADGNMNVVTSAEPGVFRYAPDGRLVGILGGALSELVITRMHDVNFTFGSRPEERYRQIINAQPTVDGLVASPEGPAILVRIAQTAKIRWQLWYPGPVRTRARVSLDVERPGPFGHMACSARGRSLACVFDQPVTAAAGAAKSRDEAVLGLFDLPRLSPTGTTAGTH